MDVSVFPRRVLRTAAALTRHELGLFALLAAIAAAPGLLGVAFLAERDQRIVILFGSFFNLYLQLFATFRSLRWLGCAPAGYQDADATEGRFPSAFFASFLSTLAIVLGLVLLVAPGLVLLALWSVWMPALAAQRLSAIQALGRSWQLARSHLCAIMVLVIVMVGLYVLALAASLLPALVLGEAGLALGDIIVEPMLAVVTIGSAVLWSATYAELIGTDSEEASAQA